MSTPRYIEWDYDGLCDIEITPVGSDLRVEFSGWPPKYITLTEAELDAVVDAAMQEVPPVEARFIPLYEWFTYVGIGG